MPNPNFTLNPARSLTNLAQGLVTQPVTTLSALQELPARTAGTIAAQRWPQSLPVGQPSPADPINPLENYFDHNTTGPGIWKWRHYFEIYHRHLARFIGQEVHILEIGIYSGGSLGMWRQYLGDRCHVYGVDIEPACKAYERDGVRVFIGDQSDRSFWQQVKKEVPVLHIVVDDGGHEAPQQIPTLEELFPHLQPGGVYMCEDLHGPFNPFVAYLHGLGRELNDGTDAPDNGFATGPLQREVHSIHAYPYLTAIEKNRQRVDQFIAPKRGTQWQPFFDK